MIAFIAAAILAQTPYGEDPNFTDIWNRYSTQLEAEGITRPMAAMAFTWTEGQYHLGLCRPYLRQSDVTFWREWWDDTPLPGSAWGRRILEVGANQYTEGLEAAITAPLTAVQCQRVADSWFADMKRLAEVRP